MKKIITIIFGLLLLVPSLMGAEPVVGDPTPAAVPGLELPADRTVDYAEGFITIAAKCKGDVKWLVVAPKVKYMALPQGLILSVPPQNGAVIEVYACGLVDGKMTEFAKTTVRVTGSPAPIVAATPLTAPQQSGFHVTFLVDMNTASPAVAQLLNAESLQKGVSQRGCFFRIYDIKNPELTKKKLDVVAQQVGGNSVMVIQKNDGQVLDARAIPKTESEILSIIQQTTGR